jgi:hypothetical protein
MIRISGRLSSLKKGEKESFLPLLCLKKANLTKDGTRMTRVLNRGSKWWLLLGLGPVADRRFAPIWRRYWFAPLRYAKNCDYLRNKEGPGG